VGEREFSIVYGVCSDGVGTACQVLVNSCQSAIVQLFHSAMADTEKRSVADLKKKFDPPRGPGKVKWNDENPQGKKRINEPGEVQGQEKPKGPPPKKSISELP
jgi:hypothetical protein